MSIIFKGAQVYARGRFESKDVLVSEGKVVSVMNAPELPGVPVVSCSNLYLFPGFIDVHVHFREPGFSYKETIRTGSLAAAHGGYTDVCAMPNVNPVPDSLAGLLIERDIIRADAVIGVKPYGAITRGEKGVELSDMRALAPYVAGFSDDGRGVQDGELMRRAMLECKKFNKVIAAHCEDERLNAEGRVTPESEYGMLARDLALLEETDCAYHACHISTKESVQLIRRAKAKGLNVTCETAPHYLLLDDMDVLDVGRFCMNPPIRAREDRDALIEGVKDGTIDMIATDHAPHAREEKRGGFMKSVNGVVGLETALPVLYTELVMPGILSLERLMALMHDAPMARFGVGADIAPGAPANLTLFDPRAQYAIDPETFLSKGRSTPFEGKRVYGECVMTMWGGNIVWQRN